MFHVVSNIFSLIFNKVLIHTNCHVASVATRGVFNFLYKETANPNIFCHSYVKTIEYFI
jgi:hypothetical protein